LGAEPHYFFLDEKVTKNQVSKEASLRSRPLPGKTDKTTGCNIFAPLSHPLAHRFSKKLLCPSRPQGLLILSVFTRSFFADAFGIEPIFCYLRSMKKSGGLSARAAGYMACEVAAIGLT
jgi:hypothetical protein